MQLKQYARYQINFFGKWVTAAGAFMGLSVFLRILHYFGIHMINDFGTGDIVLHLAIPTVLSAAYIYLLSGARWNAPGIYGIFAAVFCLLLIIWNFSSGNILRIIVSVLWYLMAGAVCLATVGGYVPGTFLSFLFFAIPFALRVFLFDMPVPGLSELFGECADLCLIAALALFPFALVSVRKADPQENDRKE